jgi:hypothetical protein
MTDDELARDYEPQPQRSGGIDEELDKCGHCGRLMRIGETFMVWRKKADVQAYPASLTLCEPCQMRLRSR